MTEPPAPCGCPRRRAGRVPRGWVRRAMLLLLADGERYGYEMITELSRRAGGTWRPSPGSVYPALQALADEGLVKGTDGEEGRRSYSLTPLGREEVGATDAEQVWAAAPGAAGPTQARQPCATHDDGLAAAVHSLEAAMSAALSAAPADRRAEVAQVLDRARREVFTILAG